MSQDEIHLISTSDYLVCTYGFELIDGDSLNMTSINDCSGVKQMIIKVVNEF